MTEEEARNKLGTEMCQHMDEMNSILTKYNYGVWMRNMSADDAVKILYSKHGLIEKPRVPKDFLKSSKEEVKKIIDIPDLAINSLEATSMRHPNKQFESVRHFKKTDKSSFALGRLDTIAIASKISAKLLVEQGNQVKETVLIGIYPKDKMKELERIYLRCCYMNEKMMYELVPTYPVESIFGFYDRRDNSLNANQRFNLGYYIEEEKER